MDKIKSLLKDNLVCICEYFVADNKKILFVLKKIDFGWIDKLKEHFNRDYLFLGLDELKDGADVFPLEFLNIKNNYKLVYGEDVVGRLKVEKVDVRRQLEFELRSKLIHLREEYMALKKQSELNDLLKAIIPTLISILEGIVYLKENGKFEDRESIFKHIKEDYGVNCDVLFKLDELNKKVWMVSFEDVKKYIKDVIVLLTDLGEKIDKIKFTK